MKEAKSENRILQPTLPLCLEVSFGRVPPVERVNKMSAWLFDPSGAPSGGGLLVHSFYI